MEGKKINCPKCGETVEVFRNPAPTVDIIIEAPDDAGIILVHRKNEPRAWAIPGGFIDYGESAEAAAEREALEETGLKVSGLKQFRVYSNPERDKRRHTISVVFLAASDGTPKAGDDADGVGIFTRDTLPAELAFDHREILRDYFATINRAKFSPFA
jgi:ADP-ribose pyrophosphatase YjhB (NUDIX family)